MSLADEIDALPRYTEVVRRSKVVEMLDAVKADHPDDYLTVLAFVDGETKHSTDTVSAWVRDRLGVTVSASTIAKWRAGGLERHGH